jgi:cobalt-precorrin-5B (C1)-methyltransferase
VQKLYGLSEPALIDMGDFVGGMLKYIRTHPLPRVTIAGGVAKMTKLAQGLLDLHSKRGAVDLSALAAFADAAGGSAELHARILGANTAAEAFALAQADGIALGDAVARAAREVAAQVVEGKNVAVEVIVFDRDGQLVGRAH